VEKGRGNHTRRFDVPLELEKLTFDAHPIRGGRRLLPITGLLYNSPQAALPNTAEAIARRQKISGLLRAMKALARDH
jgi:hypothetical protein